MGLPPFDGAVQETTADWFPATAETPVGAAGAVGVAGVDPRISTAVMFHRSVVGAVSVRVTADPPLGIALVWSCTQNVSPGPVSTHWSTKAWLGPTVRAFAASQSSPTP